MIGRYVIYVKDLGLGVRLAKVPGGISAAKDNKACCKCLGLPINLQRRGPTISVTSSPINNTLF